MPRNKKFKPVSRELLGWATNLAQTTGVDYSDLGQVEDENDDSLYDDNYDDEYEEEYGQYEQYEPTAQGNLQGRSPKEPRRMPLKQMRTQVQDRIRELKERAQEVCADVPGPLSATSNELKSKVMELANKAPKTTATTTDEWEEDQYKKLDNEIDELLEKLEDLDDSSRRLNARKQRVRDRLELLNENAISVRHDTPLPFNTGIKGLALHCQQLFKEAEGIDGWDAPALARFEQKLADFESQTDTFATLFDVFPKAEDFGEWASNQRNAEAKKQFDLMNEAMLKQPPDIKTFSTALEGLGRVRVKTEKEQERERQISPLQYMLNGVVRELGLAVEEGLFKRTELEKERKRLEPLAAKLALDVTKLRQTFRSMDDEKFAKALQGLVTRFKAIESDNDLLQGEIEHRSKEKADKEFLKSLNEKSAGPKKIKRSALTNQLTGFIMVEAVHEVSARIKKWGMYDDVDRIWRGAGENRSGPNTHVLHHHCNDNYKHNLLYDGTVILGIVDGHMEKDAKDNIRKREELVDGRKGKATCEVALTANELLIIEG